MSQKERKNNFIIQGAILGVAAIVVRVLGLLYQMPLTRIIGDLGNGYYGYAYNVYSMVLLISSFSIPIAVSKMVSARMVKREYKNVQRVFKASLFYVMVVAGLAAILTFVFAEKMVPESQAGAVPALRVLAPVIFFSGILGVFRGYFQGYNTMVPTSFSQILEGILNAVVSITAAYALVVPYAAGSEERAVYGAKGSTYGTAAGVLVGLLFLLFVYAIYKPSIARRMRKDRHKEVEEYSDLMKIIFLTVTPIIISSAIYNICPIIDQTIFANVLESKKIVHQDISVLYGIYSAKYLKLVSVPASIAAALSSAIIPAITANMMQKDMAKAKQNIDTAMRFTNLIAFPCTVGLVVLARPILLLFGNESTITLAVHVLMFGAINVIFNCISTLSNAILQGLEKMYQPVIHASVALVCHIVVCYVLLHLNYGIYALLISNTLFSLVMWILNAVAIAKVTGYKKLLGRGAFRILIASLEMGFVTWGVYQALYLITGKSFVCLLVALAVAVVSYLLFLYLANAFREEDYELLPMGMRIRNLGLRLHLIETEEHPFEEEVGEIYEEEEKPKKSFIYRKQEEDTAQTDMMYEETDVDAFSASNPAGDNGMQDGQEHRKDVLLGTEPINVYEILQKLQQQEEEAAMHLKEMQQVTSWKDDTEELGEKEPTSNAGEVSEEKEV